MAGDPNLARDSTSSASIAAHDPEDLLVWMEWFTRFRLAVPFMLVPTGYLVHRLLLTAKFDLLRIVLISFATLPITLLSVALLRRWRSDPRSHSAALRRLVSVQTIWDIVFTTVGVHFAGGAGGPFWPFPLVPVVVASALLPTISSLLLHSAAAIIATTLSSWLLGPSNLFGPLLLTLMFLSFSAVVTAAVSRRLAGLRAHRFELGRLRADKSVAEAVARRREEILSVVSHELASPLTTLRGYVRLLRESTSRDRSNTQLLERVDRQVARLSSLATDLLQMASTQAGALRLHRAPLDLVEALREAADAARLQFADAKITLTGDHQLVGVWDRDRLDQLFGNLITNAMKFAGARCRVEIRVGLENGQAAHVTVTDDGPGITEEALGRIFEPFQRYSTERGGLGLGLAIAQSIVELHAGRIWAESPDRRGACFHVVLPTSAASGRDEAPATPPPRAAQTEA